MGRPLFDCAPTPTTEHDYSGVRARLDSLVSGGVSNLEEWLLAHPEEIAALARSVRILDVNTAGLALTRARSREEAISSLDQYFTRESLPAFARAVVTLASGRPLVDCELPVTDRGWPLAQWLDADLPPPAVKRGPVVRSDLSGFAAALVRAAA